ncbi:MAG: hypothetical protein OK455_03175 [Thaumarchaeota archaeon]|nr:hypothetical protein [Nitrososphaerota archaeon]
MVGREAPRPLNWIRTAKYTFRGASLIVEGLILLIVAAPILGAITPQMAPRNEVGLGVDLQSVNSQLQFLTSSSTISGEHTVSVPAFNNWLLPATVSLSLSLMVNGKSVYQTPTASTDLAPFQSGAVVLAVDIPSSAIAQMEGQTISGGGEMTLQEAGFWSITVNLAQG